MIPEYLQTSETTGLPVLPYLKNHQKVCIVPFSPVLRNYSAIDGKAILSGVSFYAANRFSFKASVRSNLAFNGNQEFSPGNEGMEPF